MLFGTKTFRARPLATVRASALPWHAEGLLVLVEHARGVLRWTPCPPDPGRTRRSLVLGETPLLVGEADDYWCPTCEKLLALGLGRENVDPNTLDALRQVWATPATNGYSVSSRMPRSGAGELWLVLQALIASKDPRAVDEFFVDFIVRDEGQHPWLEKIAYEYLGHDLDAR